jgi:hypothetical protein
MYASPHKRALEPFACQSDYQFELPLPSIIARWDENLRRISRFNRDYGVPGLLLSWMPATRAHIEHLLRRNQFDLPVIHLPGFYRYHERWPVSASDPHPSPWATHAIAVGVVTELIELKLIPSFQLEPTDREIAERWQATGPATAEAAAALLRERLAMVPNRIDADEPRTQGGVVYGVSNGWMAANGLLCVRGGPETEQLALELDVPDFLRPAPPLIANFTTRNLWGARCQSRSRFPMGQSRHLVLCHSVVDRITCGSWSGPSTGRSPSTSADVHPPGCFGPKLCRPACGEGCQPAAPGAPAIDSGHWLEVDLPQVAGAEVLAECEANVGHLTLLLLIVRLVLLRLDRLPLVLVGLAVVERLAG